MDLKLWTASRGECSKVFRTGCPLYASILCNISGAPLFDAELPSALGQIKAPPTPTTNCVKPAPYHRHWDFLIIYVSCYLSDHWHNYLSSALGESSFHSNTCTLVSLSKARRLQPQWSNFKHIVEFVKYLLVTASHERYFSSPRPALTDRD